MELLDLIGNVATVITIFSFLTGTLICRGIYKSCSTNEFSDFPFIAGVLCTFLWLRYGLILADSTMIFVNTIGLVLQALYLAWFYLYTHNKGPLTRRILILMSFLFVIDFYIRHYTEPDGLVGLLASLSSLLFCASPLAAVSDVIQSKSTEKLPFPLIISSFVVSSLWFTYGYLLDNTFVQLPNGIGVILSAVQLSLFVIYPTKVKVKSQSHFNHRVKATKKNDDQLDLIERSYNGKHNNQYKMKTEEQFLLKNDANDDESSEKLNGSNRNHLSVTHTMNI